MKKRYILLIHFGIFIILFLLCFFSSEALLNWLMPGFYDVGSWIMLVAFETVVLFIAITVSCTIFIRKQLK